MQEFVPTDKQSEILGRFLQENPNFMEALLAALRKMGEWIHEIFKELEARWNNFKAEQGRKALRALSVKGGKSRRADLLNHFIHKSVEACPSITETELGRNLAKSSKFDLLDSNGDFVRNYTDAETIRFYDAKGMPRLIPKRAIKDRLSRAKNDSREAARESDAVLV